MTLHLKSRGYPFRPRLLFSCFIVVGVGFPNCVLFQERTHLADLTKLAKLPRKSGFVREETKILHGTGI